MVRNLFALVLIAFFAVGCTQGLYYAGMTKVEFTKDKDGVKDFMYLNGGRAIKNVNVDYECDESKTCKVNVQVEESSGIEAVKEHREVVHEFMKTFRDQNNAGMFIP